LVGLERVDEPEESLVDVEDEELEEGQSVSDSEDGTVGPVDDAESVEDDG